MGTPYSISLYGETSIITWDDDRCVKGQFFANYNPSRTHVDLIMQTHGWITGFSPPSYQSFSPQEIAVGVTCPFTGSGPNSSTVYCELGHVVVNSTTDYDYYGYMQFESTYLETVVDEYLEVTGKVYIKRNVTVWMGTFWHYAEEYSPELPFTVRIDKIP